MTRTKIQRVSSYLRKQGHEKVADELSRKVFNEPFLLTQYLNKRCGSKLKTNQWDKVLSIINND